MANELKRILLDGAELGYRMYGAEPGGPPLLFVHGYAMRATTGPYEELLQLLAKHHTVHALDLRGHGASAEALEGWSFEALADDVVAFSQALGLDRPVFVGHSFGAVIGLLAEIRHPGSFKTMCLLSPGPADHRSDPVDALKFMIENGRDREKLRGGFGKMFTRPPGGMLDLVLDAVTMVDSSVHLAQQEQNPRFSIDDRLKDVAAPVLVVCGESDTVVPPAQQHDMARKLQRCKEVVFSAEGHMMPNESAAMVEREILAFLEHDLSSPAADVR